MAKTKKDANVEVYLKDVRLSFPHIFEPQEGMLDKETGKRGKPQWKATFLIPKEGQDGDNETQAQNRGKVKNARLKAATEQWGDNPPKLKAERLCVRDGDDENYDGYAGHYYVTSGAVIESPPILVDRVKDSKGKWVELTKENGGPKKLYAGCYVNAIIVIWPQDNEFGKRINGSLKSIQFNRHGKAFSQTAVDPNEKFADVDEEEADEMVGAGADDDLI